MNGILLGVAMLVSSAGVAPTPEPVRPSLVPASFTFDVPSGATPSPNFSLRRLNEQSRPLWRSETLQPAQATAAPRCSKAMRFIAVVAGGFGGWMAGGIIGGYSAAKRDDDGANMMKGVMIGAPIGAVVGAVVGYRMAK